MSAEPFLPILAEFEPDLIHLAEKVFTGEQVLERDAQRARGILRDVLGGLSQRQVAARWQCSRNTIRALVGLFERLGLVEPEKRRLASDFEDAARLAVENSRELLEAGKVPPNVLPIMAGVFTDKSLLLRGEATEIRTLKKSVSRDDLVSWIESLPAARRGEPVAGEPTALEDGPITTTPDLQSGENPPEPEQIPESRPRDASNDAAAGRGGGGSKRGGGVRYRWVTLWGILSERRLMNSEPLPVVEAADRAGGVGQVDPVLLPEKSKNSAYARKRARLAHPEHHRCDCGRIAVGWSEGWVCARCRELERRMYRASGGEAVIDWALPNRNPRLLAIEPYHVVGAAVPICQGGL